MREYHSSYVVSIPADWTGQFFPRQIVCQRVSQATASACSTVPQSSSPHPLCPIMPTLGPLQVDLNADEDIILDYLPFMRLLYEHFFPGKKLADKPKPWRVQFLWKVIYEGWTMVRTVVKSVFSMVFS